MATIGRQSLIVRYLGRSVVFLWSKTLLALVLLGLTVLCLLDRAISIMKLYISLQPDMVTTVSAP